VVWVIAAVDIFIVAPVMGDYFLGKKVISEVIGVFGIIGLLNGEHSCNETGVLIRDCQMRIEIGLGLSSSDLDPCLRGSVSSVCLSLE
jgi:hypothetical protein